MAKKCLVFAHCVIFPLQKQLGTCESIVSEFVFYEPYIKYTKSSVQMAR